MSKWKEVRLGEVVDINKENIKRNFEGDILYVDISSVEAGILKNYKLFDYKDAPSRARRVVKDKDILYSTVRPNLKAYYKFGKNTPQNIIASTGFAVLSEKEGTSIDYIYYYTTTQSFVDYLSQIAKGAAYPAVGVDDFINTKIQIPDLKTQKKIADILSTYDELIENNNRRIEILEKTAEEIYKEWFVRMRFPGYQNTKFEKGIPKGWKVEPLINKEVELIPTGIDEFVGNKRYLATADVEGINLRYGEDIVYSERPSRANMQPRENTIWFAKMQNTIKNLYFKNYSEKLLEQIILSTGFAGLKFVNTSYYYYYLSFIRYGIFEDIKNMYSNGSTQVAINNQNIKRINLLLPCKGIINRFNSIVKYNFEMIDKYKLQNQNLTKQRDLLLPRLMNGTIKVK